MTHAVPILVRRSGIHRLETCTLTEKPQKGLSGLIYHEGKEDDCARQSIYREGDRLSYFVLIPVDQTKKTMSVQPHFFRTSMPSRLAITLPDGSS